MFRVLTQVTWIHGFTSAEAREVLGISEANQRVLLHRARSRLRASLEHYRTADCV